MNSTTSAPGSTQQPAPPPATSFFAAIRAAGFVRPSERIVAGVSGALANRWRIDPILIRVGFVVLCLFGGLGLLVYAVGWLLLPDTSGAIHLEEILAGRFSPGGVGALVLLVIGVSSVGPAASFGDGASFGGLIALASIVLVTVILLHAFGVIGKDDRARHGAAGHGSVDLTKHVGGHGTPMQHTPMHHMGHGPSAAPPGTPIQTVAEPPAPRRAPKESTPRRRGPGAAGTTLAAGLALLVAGVIVVLRDELPAGADVDAVAWAGVLGLLALALVVVGLAGRRSGGIGWLATIAAFVAVAYSVTGVAGDRFLADDVTWTPTTLDAEGATYDLATGSAVLDLTELDLSTLDAGLGTDSSAPSVPEIGADVSVGELRVLVPDDLSVRLNTEVGIGDSQGADGGANRAGAAGPPDLTLDLNVGIGSIVIEEVSR